MIVELVEIDSQVLERPVLAIHDFDQNAGFAAFESDYVRRFEPFYVSAKVPLENVAAIQALESAGFRWVECQIRSAIKLRKPYDVSPYKYEFEPVTREEDLAAVLEIAGSTFVHDRFSSDPAVPLGASGRRYQEYVRQSFTAPEEAVYRLVECDTRRTVAFKTHRYVSKTEVLFLLGGVETASKNLGVGLINGYFEFNELIRKGIRRGVTHISASNYPIFNLEIGGLGFRVVATFAVLRKVYC